MESQNNSSAGTSLSNATTSVTRSIFLKWLNEYKELVSVIVFFLGGFLWVYGVFATKEATKEQIEATKEAAKQQIETTKEQIKITNNQIKEIKCLMAANIDAIYSQIDESALSQLLIENIQEQNKLKKIVSSSDSEQKKLAQLAAAALDIQNKLQRATSLRAESNQKLRSNRCND